MSGLLVAPWVIVLRSGGKEATRIYVPVRQQPVSHGTTACLIAMFVLFIEGLFCIVRVLPVVTMGRLRVR
jgi:hypothetical protein